MVFEGIDGSGKSTVANTLAHIWENMFITREPTDSRVGRLADRVAYRDAPPYLELFLYLADRAEHTDEIKRELEKGHNVLCDRYWGSTAAYQAAHGVMSLDYLVNIQKPFVLEADMTLLFDLDVEVALERISGRDDTSKYERRNFLEKVRGNYLELASAHGWDIVDAGRELEEVKKDVYQRVAGIL